MEFFLTPLHYVWSFIVVISVVVFIHEFGHYLVARLCGVKIDAFSIGFGKEIFGWHDRSGTRWKVSWLPLGGYVKMYGDASAASNADYDALASMPEAEKRRTFHFKPLPQKAAIVSAGPLANFLLTIGIFTWFIMTSGLGSTEPVIGQVMDGTPAAEAGLQPGDRILTVNGKKMRVFNDIPFTLATNMGTPVPMVFERGGKTYDIVITPAFREEDDGFGNTVKRPLIGIRSPEIRIEEVGFPRAVSESVRRTWLICETTLKAVGQIISGERGLSELKGPVGIAQMSGGATERGISSTLWLIALLSANLGLINLFPIPALDGGHLAYYAAEALRGKPLAERVQEWGYRLGFGFVILLMGFTIFNDVRQLLF